MSLTFLQSDSNILIFSQPLNFLLIYDSFFLSMLSDLTSCYVVPTVLEIPYKSSDTNYYEPIFYIFYSKW